MKNRFVALFALFSAIVAFACGSEDIALVNGHDADGGTLCDSGTGACKTNADCCSNLCESGSCASISGFNGCAGNGSGCAGPTSCCSNACTGGSCAAALDCHPNGASCTTKTDCCSNACGSDGKCAPSTCEANGATCGANADCCTGRCDSGFCVNAGTCTAPTQACDPKNDNCCSGRCEPVQGETGVTACTNFCVADGTACTRALDCCLLDCNGGTCNGAECKIENDDCTNNAECCSNICGPDAKCVLDSANTTCRPTGETCNSGPQEGCCSGICDETVNPPRCAVGTGTCRNDGATCTADADCCHGTCDPTAHVCKTACVATSGACTTSIDCCSSNCVNGSCAAPPGSCTELGGACTTSTQCCGAFSCVGSVCVAPPR